MFKGPASGPATPMRRAGPGRLANTQEKSQGKCGVLPNVRKTRKRGCLSGYISHNAKGMRIINVEVLDDFARRHADARRALQNWEMVATDAIWSDLADVRKTYATADGVRLTSGAIVTVFNIRGNNYRLLTNIIYPATQIDVLAVLTHAEYDKEAWKTRY